jgi:hypothetical protein
MELGARSVFTGWIFKRNKKRDFRNDLNALKNHNSSFVAPS